MSDCWVMEMFFIWDLFGCYCSFLEEFCLFFFHFKLEEKELSNFFRWSNFAN